MEEAKKGEDRKKLEEKREKEETILEQFKKTITLFEKKMIFVLNKLKYMMKIKLRVYSKVLKHQKILNLC